MRLCGRRRPPDLGDPKGGPYGRRPTNDCRRIRPFPLSRRNQAVPDAGAAGGIYARQALARARRPRRRAQARHLASASRRQNRHGLPRLRPADRRSHFRGQCRPDAGGAAIRAREGLQARHLRDVVDPGVDSRIYPAFVVARENGHHRQPEEAVLQSAQGQEQDLGASTTAISSRIRSR